MLHVCHSRAKQKIFDASSSAAWIRLSQGSRSKKPFCSRRSRTENLILKLDPQLDSKNFTEPCCRKANFCNRFFDRLAHCKIEALCPLRIRHIIEQRGSQIKRFSTPVWRRIVSGRIQARRQRAPPTRTLLVVALSSIDLNAKQSQELHKFSSTSLAGTLWHHSLHSLPLESERIF